MRLLFVTSTRVGDAVLSTGILDRLIAENPGARVTVACGASAASLFEAVPGLERIIVLDKMLGSLHWMYLWTNTVGHIWDILVDLRSAPLTYLLASKKSYRMSSARGEDIHRVRLLGRVIGAEQDPPAPKIWIADRHRAAAERLIPPGGPVLAIGPTANWRGKQWRADSFAELIARLTAPDGILPGARVAIFGRDDERPMALPVIESIPQDRLLDLVGRNDLLTVYACLARSAFYIGNDSGLMHLAAASGIPTLGLFGPSQASLYAPWGPLSAHVQAKLSYDEIFPEGFDHRNTDTLMDSLSVDRAAEAAGDLWRRARDAAA